MTFNELKAVLPEEDWDRPISIRCNSATIYLARGGTIMGPPEERHIVAGWNGVVRIIYPKPKTPGEMVLDALGYPDFGQFYPNEIRDAVNTCAARGWK